MFNINARIYYEDTDAGGIVYYANYLKFLERARTEFLRSIGFAGSSDLYKENPFGFAVRKVNIEYLRPAVLDDLLTVTCEITNVGGASIVCKQQIFRGEEQLIDAEVTCVHMDLTKLRPVKIPQNMREKFSL
ncbi:MAG: tol-pal system-associated acyl-CoA thioesterase [Alphaproteobacteria bacterium]